MAGRDALPCQSALAFHAKTLPFAASACVGCMAQAKASHVALRIPIIGTDPVKSRDRAAV